MDRHVVVEQDSETGEFAVWCPELPGCVSAGSTEEEAMANIKQAIALYLERDTVEMLPEYDFTGGVRGRYAQRYAEGTCIKTADG